MPYLITQIQPGAPEDTEQLGSKPKFWLSIEGHRWLFKENRANTGEDWAEKAASEIARVLGIPSAEVELAEYNGLRGCISKNFINVSAGEALIHGNEILGASFSDYDKSKTFRQSDHTIKNILESVRAVFPKEDLESALTQLASYMVLDALIGNTDRHHENWGLKLQPTDDPRGMRLSVAPSFDHASSLGRELLDERRAQILRDGQVTRYLARGRGGIFSDPEDPHGENPLRLVQIAARAYSRYFKPALARIEALSIQEIRSIMTSLPEDRTSPLARDFAEAVACSARTTLLEILK